MIYRQQIELRIPFTAPENITFGYQAERDEFSFWYKDGDPHLVPYVVVGTGERRHEGTLVQSFVMPDGFEVYHLLKL